MDIKSYFQELYYKWFVAHYKAECPQCGRIRDPKTGKYYATSMGAKQGYRHNSKVLKENCPDYPDCLEKRLEGLYDDSEPK